ncbi:MAG TPA: exodeoxyribonuclease VII small subunit [Gemmatimonadaceae bacterium]|nr:exodeoxyribonuclease VII small subunit [Gemmatimonadaceae bacterium]
MNSSDSPSSSNSPNSSNWSNSSNSFESHLARLEEIVAELEGDELELDAALRLFEEGIERLRDASAGLARAEERVKLLVERLDGTVDVTEIRD